MGGSEDAATAATPKLAHSGSDLPKTDRVDGSGPTDPALADGVSQIKIAVSTLQHLVNTIGTLNDAGRIPENMLFAIDFDERQKVQEHIVEANQILKDVCDLAHEMVGTINSIGHKPRWSNSFPSCLPLVMFGIVPVAVGIVFAARRGMFW